MVPSSSAVAWVSRAFVLGRVIGITLLAYAALIFIVQRRLAFPGSSRESPRPTPTAPAGVTQVWLEASFGPVEAWFFRAEGNSARPTVIFAHGNGELIEDWRPEMERLTAAGLDALLVEFPGYGHSQGSPSRRTLREAFTLAFDWLVEQTDVDQGRIVVHGRSMGGGAASDLALDRPVRALILQSTFSSATAIARRSLVPGFLVRDRFDNQRAVANFSGPVLLMHGLHDDVIPYSHAEVIADAREGLEVTHIACAHNDCGRIWPDVVDILSGFLRSNDLL
jgi:pimeloyl-ACP methyl ester carboxylesterase